MPRADRRSARHLDPSAPRGVLVALRDRVLRTRRVAAATVVVSLVAAPLLAVATAAPAEAAITTPFTRAFATNAHGDTVILGNTLLSCVTGSTDCTAARAGTANGTGLNNNQFAGGFVDVDADAATFNSSSVTVTVPPQGSVLYAALVWGARTVAGGGGSGAPAPTQAQRNRIRFATPATGGYVDVADTNPAIAPDNDAYQGFVDVTGLVQAGGSGTYTAANVQAARGTDRYAGWALVVVLADPTQPSRNLTVFEGFGTVADAAGSRTATIPVSGFLTPPEGQVRTTLGHVSYEGDLGSTGDSMSLDGEQLFDGLNPAANVFNSTLSARGTATAGRTPSYANQLGFDADTLSADGVLDNDATSARIDLTTGGETYYPGVITFATDLYEPQLDGEKTAEDVNGGALAVGDVLRYTVPVSNTGLDAAVNSRIVDSIPTGTTYVPGSIVVDGVARTDAVGDDAARYEVGPNGGYVTANVGVGATATAGGTIPTDGTTHTLEFDVRVDASVVPGQDIVNAADLLYRGATTGEAGATVTNAVTSVVAGTPPGGAAPTTQPDVTSFSPEPGRASATVPVLANDGAGLTVEAVTDPAGGAVVVNPDGTVTYTPRPDFAGRDVFTYTVRDQNGAVTTELVYVDVLNELPTAVADTASAPKNVATTIAVLANDTDPNGDALSLVSVPGSSTQGGTLAAQPDGTVLYTPAPGFVGTDTFTYVMQDSRGARRTATVTVTVTNTAPVGVADALATQSGAGLTFGSLLANDADANGDVLTAQVVTGPAHGTLTLNPDGTGTYTPAAGYAGPDSFTYRPFDGTVAGAPVTVTVGVNGSPVPDVDAITTATDTAGSVDVLVGDSDPNGDALSVTAVTDGAHGTVVRGAGGLVTYTPAAGYAGPDSFSYTVSDGRGGSATGTVTVTVENAPPVAVDDQTGTAPATAVTFEVRTNDTDPNITTPAATTQALVVTGATVTAGDGMVVVEQDGRLTVTPATGFKGDLVVTYVVGDGAGGTDTATLTVTVDDAAPVAGDDPSVTTPTDESVLVDVLLNDTDPNDDPLTLVSVGTPTAAGGAVRGTTAVEGGRVRYTPPAGFAGTVTFTYVVTDGVTQDVATVTVVVQNAGPVATDDTATTATGTPVDVDVLDNDRDPNVPGTDQELGVVGAQADQDADVSVNPDGTLRVVPAPGFKGVVTVTYQVSDGAGGTDEATLVVTVDNAAPGAVDDVASTPYAQAVTVDVVANDTDANGDALSVVAGSLTAPVDARGATRGTVALVDGRPVYTPPAGFSGPVTFHYAVTDGAAVSTATVTVTVGGAPPVATPDRVSGVAGQPVRIDVLGNDSDADGGTLRVTAVSATRAGGTVVVDGGSLVYTPPPGFSGTDTFTYTVTDGQGGTTTTTVTVEVAAAPGSGPGGSGNGSGSGAGAAGSGDGSGSGGGSAAGRLPRTGLEVAQLLAAGLALVAGGAGTVLVARRRRGVTA